MAGVRAFLARWWPTAASGAGESSLEEHQSILVYRGFRYLKVAVALCLLSIVAYLWHDPYHGPSGNTWLGYTLGTIGLFIILLLSWLGVRKRQFREGAGPVQGWVSAHIYLGLSLIVVATLHSGFQFGMNVHLFAYVLMLLVIISGLYGLIAYSRLPSRITRVRNGQEFRAMLAEVARLNEQSLKLADEIDAETHAVVARSVANVRIGGSGWEQITGRYRQREASSLDRFLKLKDQQMSSAAEPSGRGGRQATIAFVADQIFDTGRAPRGERLQRLLRNTSERKALVERINRDITLRARLNVWLFVHVPLTVALLAAMLVHVLSVFLYW